MSIVNLHEQHFYRDNDRNQYLVLFVDRDKAFVSDGVRKSIISKEQAEDWEDITESLGLYKFEHLVTMRHTSGSEEDFKSFLNAMINHAIEINRRWITTIQQVSGEVTIDEKMFPDVIKHSIGYWRKAVAYLDTVTSDGSGDLAVSVALEGDIFVNRILEAFDGEEVPEDVRLQEYLKVHPRYINYNDQNEYGPSRFDFDIQVFPKKVQEPNVETLLNEEGYTES